MGPPVERAVGAHQPVRRLHVDAQLAVEGLVPRVYTDAVRAHPVHRFALHVTERVALVPVKYPQTAALSYSFWNGPATEDSQQLAAKLFAVGEG